MKEKQIDCREYARQMRENCLRDNHGNIICSGELWEEIANIIEGFAGYRKQSEGEWIKYPHNSGIYCSLCKHKRRYRDIHDAFCPNCGAKMKGGKE